MSARVRTYAFEIDSDLDEGAIEEVARMVEAHNGRTQKGAADDVLAAAGVRRERKDHQDPAAGFFLIDDEMESDEEADALLEEVIEMYERHTQGDDHVN